ncbi:MAG: ATP-dependent helicase [bacterium]
MELNETQKKAVKHKVGPMMVLAGPGSGKTMVITYRTKYLIEKYNVNPRNILVITFTKAAADEMKERFLELINSDKTSVTFGTFHSVFFRILRLRENYKVGSVITEDRKYKVLLQIIKSLKIEYEDENEIIRDILSEISNMTNELIELDNYHSNVCSDCDFRRIINSYKNFKQKHRLIDFDDMLKKCYRLLLEDNNILSFWQNKYKYILIDEFQDINRIQYECVKMLVRPENNLFVVGDDDQAIYQFRGARPDFLLGFPKDYKNVDKVVLNKNYRSTKRILKSGLNVISHNNNRYKKALNTLNEEGEKPLVLSCENAEEEANQITQSIRNIIINKKIALSEIAVIYRTNIQARLYIERLMDLNIPFVVKDQMANIFDHWIAKDIIAYFSLSGNIKDSDALTRIINKPKRYVNKEVVLAAKKNSPNIWEGLYKSYDDKNWMVERFEELKYHIQTIRRLTPYEGIKYIRKAIGYDDYLVDYANFRKVKDEGLIEIADDLQESAKSYKTLNEWLTHIESYSKELKEQYKKNKSKEAVTLTTVHSAKGLEFNTVYLIGCNEGLLPHDKSNDNEGLEEERRLFYVGITRAKKKLILSYFKERNEKNMVVSRFISELNLPLSNLVKGTEE